MLMLAAKLNVHVPCAYPKDVLSWFPTQRASQVGELMPYR
jgi:transposase